MQMDRRHLYKRTLRTIALLIAALVVVGISAELLQAWAVRTHAQDERGWAAKPSAEAGRLSADRQQR